MWGRKLAKITRCLDPRQFAGCAKFNAKALINAERLQRPYPHVGTVSPEYGGPVAMYSTNSDKYCCTSYQEAEGGLGTSKADEATRGTEESRANRPGQAPFGMDEPIRRGGSDAGSARRGSRTAFMGHVRSCGAIQKNLGVKLWLPQGYSCWSPRVVYSAKDMAEEDWKECECGFSLTNRTSMDECALTPSGVRKHRKVDLVWTNPDLKPIRSWSSKVLGRKQKIWKHDGTGRYRDTSTSPVSDLECNCDIANRAGLLHLCGGHKENSDNSSFKNKYINNIYNLAVRGKSGNPSINRIKVDLGKNTMIEVPSRAGPSGGSPTQSKGTTPVRKFPCLSSETSGSVTTSPEQTSPPQRVAQTPPRGDAAMRPVTKQNMRKRRRKRKSGAQRRKEARSRTIELPLAGVRPSASFLGPALHPQVLHIGNRSVTGQNVKVYEPDFQDNKAAQNAIRYIADHMNGWGPNVHVDVENNVVVSTRWGATTMTGQPRTADIPTVTTRLIEADEQLDPIAINLTGGREVQYVMSDSDAGDLIKGASVDSRRLAGTMNAGPAFPPAVIEKLAPLLLSRKEKVNNAALYGIGWLGIHQLHALEVGNVAIVYRDAIADALVVRDTNVILARHAELANQFEEDLGRGRIFIDGKRFTPAELSMIRLLASGAPLGVSPPQARRSILQYVASAVIPMAVYNYGNLVVPAIVPGEWNSGRLFVLLRKMATELDDEESWLQGFMRVATIVKGTIVEWQEAGPPIVRHRRWMNAMYEACGSAWPCPGGTNPMWGWAGVKPTFEMNVGNKAEIVALGTMTVHESVLCGYIVGSLVANGITTLLIKLNLTTVQLNDYFYGNNPGQAGQLLRTLLAVRAPGEEGGRCCPLMVRAGVNWAADFTGLRMDWGHLTTGGWNNFNEGGDAANRADNMWRGLAEGAPRHGNVMHIGFIMDVLPDVWCILAPPITIDVSDEIVQDAGDRFWSAQMGEDKYENVAGSLTPYDFVTYGPTALAVLHQQFGVRAGWPLQMRRIGTVTRKKRILLGDRVDPLVPAAWVLIIGVIIPGTVQSYDWANRVVLAPEVTEGVIGPHIFNVLANGSEIKCWNAGCIATRVVETRRIEAGFAGLALLGKMPGAGPPMKKEDTAAGAGEQVNQEN